DHVAGYRPAHDMCRIRAEYCIKTCWPLGLSNVKDKGLADVVMGTFCQPEPDARQIAGSIRCLPDQVGHGCRKVDSMLTGTRAYLQYILHVQKMSLQNAEDRIFIVLACL